jgi:hypothetical protein
MLTLIHADRKFSKGYLSLKKFICFVFLTVWLIPLVHAKPPEIQLTGVFSSLKYNQEGGDLLGIEAFIFYGGGEYWLLFQDSDGSPNKPQLVKANVSEDSLEFTILDSWVLADGKIESRNRNFKGVISKTHILGKFNDSNETIRLSRKKSYWQ